MEGGRSTTVIVTVAVLFAAAPVVLMVLAWMRWLSTPAPSRWRRWAALAALIFGSLGALAQPTIFLILSIHQEFQWLNRIEIVAIEGIVLVGFILSLPGIPLASFGWGRVRWLVLPACLLSAALCYISGLAASY